MDRTNFNRLVTLIRYTSCDAFTEFAVDPGRSMEEKSSAQHRGCVTDWQQETRSLVLFPPEPLRHSLHLACWSDSPKALACSIWIEQQPSKLTNREFESLWGRF